MHFDMFPPGHSLLLPSISPPLRLSLTPLCFCSASLFIPDILQHCFTASLQNHTGDVILGVVGPLSGSVLKEVNDPFSVVEVCCTAGPPPVGHEATSKTPLPMQATLVLRHTGCAAEVTTTFGTEPPPSEGSPSPYQIHTDSEKSQTRQGWIFCRHLEHLSTGTRRRLGGVC